MPITRAPASWKSWKLSRNEQASSRTDSRVVPGIEVQDDLGAAAIVGKTDPFAGRRRECEVGRRVTGTQGSVGSHAGIPGEFFYHSRVTPKKLGGSIP